MKRIFLVLMTMSFISNCIAAYKDLAYQNYLLKCMKLMHEDKERARISQEQLIEYLPRDLANIIKEYLESRSCISYDQWQKNNKDFLKYARFGIFPKVQELLDEVDINTKDEFGCTALMYAAEGEFEEIIELLIQANADINAKNNNGETALMTADRLGHKEIVELLIKAGATS